MSGVRGHIIFATFCLGALIGAVIAAAALIEINGAVIAPGSVVVESNVKRIQHQDGGIIKSIHVREGQLVGAGDLLVTLDDTLAQANLAITEVRLTELLTQEARLKAERDGRDSVVAPAALRERLQEPEVMAIMEGQSSLFRARHISRKGRRAQLAEQISQLEEEIAGLTSQREAKGAEVELVAKELDDLRPLIEKGLIQRSRITALKRDKVKLEGEHGRLTSQIAQAGQAISERKIQVLQIDEEMRNEVAEQLPEVRGQIAQLAEKRIAELEQLRRLEIRAPRAGFVHQLAVHTVGGVVTPGEDMLLIVPEEDLLVIEVRVSPNDIDQLVPAQETIIRLPGMDRRTTPELNAQIVTISADLMQDPESGVQYYKARIALPDDEIAKLGEERLVPGMPVEAFVQTGSRTILSYLLKPLLEQAEHAFREN